MKFDITKKVPLEYEGWENCYIELYLPSYGDLKGITNDPKTADAVKVENGLKTIEGLFKSGFAMSGGERVEIKKEDVSNLPIEVLTKCFQEISGVIPPK